MTTSKISTSKISTSDQQGRNVRCINGTSGSNRTINSRKTVSVVTDTAKEVPMSRRKNLPRKKHPVNEDLPSGQIVPDISSRNGSAAFIPILLVTCYFRKARHYLPGFNVIGGDALSAILKKKLQELTSRIESSNCNIIIEGTSTSLTPTLKNSVPATTTSAAHNERLPVDQDNDIAYSSGDLDRSSDNLAHDWRRKWQQSEEIEEQNAACSSSETGIEVDNRHPVLLSALEPAVTSAGCSSSRNCTTTSMSDQDQEVLNGASGSESRTEIGTELTDSASSKPAGETNGTLSTMASNSTDYKQSIKWEADFVKMVLKDSELLFKEYASGQTEKVMTLKAFNQLEHPNGTERNGEDYKLAQKLLPDYVSECLEARYRKVLVGSCKGRVNWEKTIQQPDRLDDKLSKEISGWKSMGDTMVDDIVDMDMSTKHGRWLDFDMEALEQGVEIQKNILTSLVDELVSDLSF
ncbi:Detected protein of unknown function [Hibiscus syriacus]|uniref:DUF4378 domain-containing protein n=1 Tax=Hibiscus syriacus TaxID=106335 RepID=A0A6A2YY86_HIBSY|nr:Detected protein of unknown function [Hibiscus syriacus]